MTKPDTPTPLVERLNYIADAYHGNDNAGADIRRGADRIEALLAEKAKVLEDAATLTDRFIAQREISFAFREQAKRAKARAEKAERELAEARRDAEKYRWRSVSEELPRESCVAASDKFSDDVLVYWPNSTIGIANYCLTTGEWNEVIEDGATPSDCAPLLWMPLPYPADSTDAAIDAEMGKPK